MGVLRWVDSNRGFMVKMGDAESKHTYALDAWQVCKIVYILKIKFAVKWTDAESKLIYALNAWLLCNKRIANSCRTNREQSCQGVILSQLHICHY